MVVDYKVSAVDYKVLKLENYIPGMDCSRLQGCVVDYKVLKFKNNIPERNRSRLQSVVDYNVPEMPVTAINC